MLSGERRTILSLITVKWSITLNITKESKDWLNCKKVELKG